LHRAPCHQDAAVRLVQAELDAVPRDLRKAFGQRRAVEYFERDADALMHFDALRGVRLGAAEEKHNPRRVEDRQAGAARQPPPLVQ
jgi:hypothetical protein